MVAADHRHAGAIIAGFPGLCGDVHYATGGVAIEQGAWATQYGELFHRKQINAVQLRLAIRQGFRETVHIQAQSPDPERSTGTKTP